MVDEALCLFKEMQQKNLVPNTITYNTLIDGLCKCGRISYVWELLDEMRDRGQPPDLVIYGLLLHAFCKNKHLDRAIGLFKQIVDQGLKIDVFTYNIIIDGLCKGGRLKTAQELFQNLLVKENRSSPIKIVECGICHDEDEDSNMESPCSCSGSLEYAHLKCVERWCNEKGDTISEICQQLFEPGLYNTSSISLWCYSIELRVSFMFGESMVTFGSRIRHGA
ncbi:hypothetical protein L6164_006415 [Bauhinia variegata]|uniref:Uncharacterized protein n=1 Tax=Bauhinia variegata TaxID=167791 RepID=A0ACB9PVT6_BAUVA|nr:hypothetical protein L6164_006415 [Bauhinia variegata]